MDNVTEIWVYLSEKPLLYLVLTIVAYGLGQKISQRTNGHPLANPVMLTIMIIVAVLVLTNTPYPKYFEGAKFIHFLLGPATVALAVPLYRQLHHVRRAAPALLVALLSGSIFAVVSAVGLAWLLGIGPTGLASMAPKSVTVPIAMALAEEIDGLPSLAAVLVLLTGISGAALGPAVLTLMRVRNHAARGFALGVVSHGIGTARALQEHERAGAFAGLAIGLNALVTAIALPFVWGWLGL